MVAPAIIIIDLPYLDRRVLRKIRTVIGPVGVRKEINAIRKGRRINEIIG